MNLICHILMLLILSKRFIICIKLDNYCQATERECKGFYHDRYQVKCSILCPDKYSVKCEEEEHLCATSQRACVEHKEIKTSINSFFRTIYHEVEKIKFIMFNNRIRKCPIVHHTWRSSEVCYNNLKCYELKKLLTRSGSFRYEKRVECPCRGMHSYHCGKHYCAAHKAACDGFFLKHQENSEFKFLGIKTCNSNFTPNNKTIH